MSAPPPVSIGLPVYNGGRWLPRAMDDLLNQTFGEFELVISDNASTDATEEMCRQFAAQDRRIRYVRQPVNVGINANHNIVFAHARGELFKWAAVSDMCHRELLAKCVGVVRSRPDVVLCYPKTRLIDGQDAVIGDYSENLDLQDERPSVRGSQLLGRLALNVPFHGVMRTSALAAVMPLRLYMGSDMALMFALVVSGKYVELPEFLFQRRMDAETATVFRYSRTTADEYIHGKNLDRRGDNYVNLNYFYDCFRFVSKANVSLGEKVRLCRSLLTRARWSRRELVSELCFPLRAAFRNG
jgi:glycosyltransferase involved in cell wall biosynthesis